MNRGPLTQAELASWIGSARETVERLLADWRKRGIVQTGYMHIDITDEEALQRIAGVRHHEPPSAVAMAP
jgi:DNA-binding transcriptional regulator LsrR (DeoR family)